MHTAKVDVFLVIKKNRSQWWVGGFNNLFQKGRLRFAVYFYRSDGRLFHFLNGRINTGKFVHNRIIVAKPFLCKINYVCFGNLTHAVDAAQVGFPALVGSKKIINHKGHVHDVFLLSHPLYFEVVDGCNDEVFVKVAFF